METIETALIKRSILRNFFKREFIKMSILPLKLISVSLQSCLLQISPLHTHIHYDLHLPLTSYKQCINSNHFSPSNNKWLLIIMLQKHSFTEGMEKSAVSSWFILCCYCHLPCDFITYKKKVHEIESDLILLSLPSLSRLSVRIVNCVFLRRNLYPRYDNSLTFYRLKKKTNVSENWVYFKNSL